jgi:hypothetical protein
MGAALLAAFSSSVILTPVAYTVVVTIYPPCRAAGTELRRA